DVAHELVRPAEGERLVLIRGEGAAVNFPQVDDPKGPDGEVEEHGAFHRVVPAPARVEMGRAEPGADAVGHAGHKRPPYGKTDRVLAQRRAPEPGDRTT